MSLFYTSFVLLFCTLVTPSSGRDYCVVGAGPSGLQIGYYLERNGRDYVIFERDQSPGWFYKVYPRHRMLISINKRFTGKTNKEFNLRHDWNSLLSDNDELLMTKYSKEFFPSADTLVQYLKDYAEKLHLKVQYNTYIKKISKKDNDSDTYILQDKEGNSYTCDNIIISTGLWVENVPKNISGIDHTEGYPKMSVNPDDYEGQSVLIIGRGNSGFEIAQHLQGSTSLIHMMSRGRLRLSWETHYVGDVRAINDGPIDTYQLKSLDGQLEGDIRQISFQKFNGKIFLSFGEGEDFTPDNMAMREGYDRVIRCTGFKFDRSIFDKDVRPNNAKIARKYPDIGPNYESTKSKNMYFTGTATHSLDFRKSAGGFIHGFRYTTRALSHLLEWKNHGVHWPSVTLPNKDLFNYLLKRINEGSGIYQMFSALTDVIVFRDSDMFEYFEEVPIGVLPEFEKHTGRSFERGIVINLEYGKNFSGPGSDPFKEDRATGEAQEAHTSNFLHPVLYYYDNGIPPLEGFLTLARPKRLHHMVEDFLTEWIAPVAHLLPLRWFIEYCTGEDMRKFYVETCFQYSMTGATLPASCQHEYLQGFGLPRPTNFVNVNKAGLSSR